LRQILRRLAEQAGTAMMAVPAFIFLPKGIFVLNPIKKSFAYGDHTVTLETAEIARQAGGAVMVTMDDTVVLATVVGALKRQAGPGFLSTDRRLSGAHLRRRPHPGRLLQARRGVLRKRKS
jgi:hypothetical protein